MLVWLLLDSWALYLRSAGLEESAGQNAKGVSGKAVGPISKICRPGVLEAAGLGSAGQSANVVSTAAVGPIER